MKTIFFILSLIPVMVSAQRPIDQPLRQDFKDSVIIPLVAAPRSMYIVGKGGTTFNLNGFDSIYANNLKLFIDTTRRKVLTYDVVSKTLGYSYWLYAGSGGGGGVTNVATGYGLSGGPITSTGTIVVDTTNIVTKATTQIISGQKIITGATIFYQNTVNGSAQTTYQNNGASSTGKTTTLGLGGSNGAGITGLANAFLTENTADGGTVISNYGGDGTKFMYGTGRNIVQYFQTTGACFACTTPDSWVHIGAGTTSVPPLKLTTGTALSSIEDGALEYHSSHLYFSIGSTRYQLDQQGGFSNPLTTTGDIIYSSSGTTAARRGIGSTNQVLTVSSGVPNWGPIVTSAAYTPTLTAVTNATSPTNDGDAFYQRIGDYVVVYGSLEFNATAGATLTQVDVSLPFASAMTVLADLQGNGTVVGSSAMGAIRVDAEITNDRAKIIFRSDLTGLHNIKYTFMYRII